ncbi:MAG: DUF2236 domain-containing protein [Myxococcales bacterium]|nr:DUF2236 domain-containing protein [Myxococcales bacterium]
MHPRPHLCPSSSVHHASTSIDAWLDARRPVADDRADAAVRELYARGRATVVAYNRAMAKVSRNAELAALPEEVPPAVDALLTDPELAAVATAGGGWDALRLARGAAFFGAYALAIPMILQLATMPTLYGARRPVQVLTFTGRLEREAHRRSVETAQLVFDVMDPRGLAPRGAGRVSALKVRLLHAAVRLQITGSGRWDAQDLGAPINQEDLLGVLGSFTVLVLDALRELGATFDDQEAEDYYYRWTAVAALLGIEDVPKTLSEMRRVFAAIRRRQIIASPEGARLSSAWIETLERTLPGPMAARARAMMRQLVGRDVAAAIGLDDAEDAALRDEPKPDALAFVARVDQALGRRGLPRALFERASGLAIRAHMAVERRFKRHCYPLPMAGADATCPMHASRRSSAPPSGCPMHARAA